MNPWRAAPQLLAVILLSLLVLPASAVLLKWAPYGDSDFKVFPHQTALFGPKAFSYNVTASIAIGSPVLGCNATGSLVESHNLTGTIVMLRRGNCTFSEKVYNAQLAGAVGVIIGDTQGSQDTKMVIMSESDEYEEDAFKIPAVFILNRDFESVQEIIEQSEGVLVELNSVGEIVNMDAFNRYLQALKILSIVLMVLPSIWCFLAAFLIIRRMYMNHRNRERRRYRLVHIPTMVFKGDLVNSREHTNWLHNSSCAICLDEFDEGRMIKRLECSHAFHPTCIDPWLENRSDLCPICKRSILQGHDEIEDGSWEHCKTFLISCVQRCFPCIVGRRYQLIRQVDEDEAENLDLS